MYQLKRMLKRGVKVLCLNGATVAPNCLQDADHNSSAANLDDSNSFSTRYIYYFVIFAHHGPKSFFTAT